MKKLKAQNFIEIAKSWTQKLWFLSFYVVFCHFFKNFNKIRRKKKLYTGVKDSKTLGIPSPMVLWIHHYPETLTFAGPQLMYDLKRVFYLMWVIP